VKRESHSLPMFIPASRNWDNMSTLLVLGPMVAMMLVCQDNGKEEVSFDLVFPVIRIKNTRETDLCRTNLIIPPDERATNHEMHPFSQNCPDVQSTSRLAKSTTHVRVDIAKGCSTSILQRVPPPPFDALLSSSRTSDITSRIRERATSYKGDANGSSQVLKLQQEHED
jgi:hypothetical protein